jgi:beta-glucanase (GH16 family)
MGATTRGAAVLLGLVTACADPVRGASGDDAGALDAAAAGDAGHDAGAGDSDAGRDAGLDAGSRPHLGDVDAKNRALTWADEFDGPQIDRAVWGNEEGMVRNHERQCYTKDDKNQFIEGGELVIRGIPEGACGGTFTSASLTTEGHQSFQYGRLEARIRVPSAKGSWPAFWLLPADKAKYAGLPPYNSWWPAGGEIDVMEVVSQKPTTVYGTAHYLQSGAHGSSGASSLLSAPVSATYHVFAIEWTTTKIDWFVDDAKYHSFDTTPSFDGLHPFQDRFYLILNYAIGGDWPEVPDAAQYPDQMRVDWVRYWK